MSLINNAHQNQFRKYFPIYFFAGLISILLSLNGSIRGEVINIDGICYLQSAAALSISNLKTAMHLCGNAQWPLYSMLIYALSSVTHISNTAAAFILNGLFSLISVISFIYLVSLATSSKTILFFSALVILVSHEFNSVRELIIRDHGFWAFYLLSCIFLTKFYQHYKWPHALAWSFMLMIATLFRIEGAVFLIFLPLAILFYKDLTLQQRFRLFLKLNTLSILAFIGVILFIATHHNQTALSRLNEIPYQFSHGFVQLKTSFEDASAVLNTKILSVFATGEANTVLVLMLASWFTWSVIRNVSCIYFFLILFVIIKKIPNFAKAQNWVIVSYIIINLCITAIYLMEHMFLSNRYLIALSLMLMLWVPFALNAIYENLRRMKLLFAIVCLVMLFTALGGIFNFGYSKLYIKHSGEWLDQHAPINAKIFSNDLQVLYFTNHFGINLFSKFNAEQDINILDHGGWHQYDYIALHILAKDKKKNAYITDEIALTPAHVYANKRGDQVIIYHVKRGDS